MHVSNVLAVGAQRVGDVGFLDVHVEQIGEDYHVVRVQCVQERHRVLGAVEQVALITVERLVN